jgi:hypothetical protein
MSAVCSIPGCGVGGRITRGWCSKHYQRWHTHGDPTEVRRDVDGGKGQCIHPGCEKGAIARNMCQNHLKQFKMRDVMIDRAREHAKINPITDVDLAYLAGMIDADGMVTFNAGKSPRPMVCISNSNFDLIKWCLHVIGAGCAYETKSVPKRADQNRDNWNAVHRYQLTGRKAQTLLLACLPYMKVKRAQADLVLAAPMRGRDFATMQNEEHRKIFADLMVRVRALNKRGKGVA